MKGDALYVRRADGGSGDREYQGFVHVVHKEEVRACVWGEGGAGGTRAMCTCHVVHHCIVHIHKNSYREV